MVKNSAYYAGDLGSIPGLGNSPGEGNGDPLQHSCLENSMEREAWWAIVHRISSDPERTALRGTGRKQIIQKFYSTGDVV